MRGFSLIELVIVVMIIGVIGAIAIPRLSRGAEGARVSAFISDLNTFANAIERYRHETRDGVSDSTTGRFPDEMKGYLHPKDWEQDTPLGGRWDIEANDTGVVLAVGVHYLGAEVDSEGMQAVDDAMDDGALKTGAFRQIDRDRFYLILEN